MTYANPIFWHEAKDIMKNWVDPEAKAEAERYDNPIPSRILISDTIEKRQAPQSHADLVEHFNISFLWR